MDKPVITAKFKCNSATANEGTNNKTVNFTAVSGNEGEDATFTKFTPAGSLSMTVDKETLAYDFFEEGKDYYLKIEAAEHRP